MLAAILGLMAFPGLTYGSVAALLAEMFPPNIRYSSMSIPYHFGTGYFGGFLPLISAYVVARDGRSLFGPLVHVGRGRDGAGRHLVLAAGRPAGKRRDWTRSDAPSARRAADGPHPPAADARRRRARRQLALARAQSGGAACGAAVKADGYGLGAREVVKRLQAAGCRDFFVATWAEAGGADALAERPRPVGAARRPARRHGGRAQARRRGRC